jgi:hypothetical protein
MICKATTLFTASLALASLATAQDPFAGGVRWHFSATDDTPWLPQTVSFGARENLVLLGTEGVTQSLAVLDRAAFGAHTPRFSDTTFPSGATHVATVSGWNEDLFSAIQVPAPTKFSRATLVARHDLIAATQGAAFAPTWVHDAGLLTNGPARLSTDLEGDTVVLAIWDNQRARVQIDFLEGESGALTNRVVVPGAALNQIEISEDGSVVAVSAGIDLYIFDATGQVLHHEVLNAATRALSLSGDGGTLAVGGISQLAIFTPDSGGVWSNTFNALAPNDEVVTAVDLSRDGGVLGLAWWNFANGVDVRLDIWNLQTVSKVTSLPMFGTPNGPQNLPEVAEVTPDGQHVAFGTWGNGDLPQVLVLRPGEDLPLYGVDLPGSVRDLDLSDSGNRLLVAYKSTHNNASSNKGGVLLYESGAQTISQLNAAVTGGSLGVSTRLQGAGVAFLAIGERAAPTEYPGVTGELWLDRASLQVLVQPTQAGRSDFALAIPDDASLIGTQWSMQPAWRAFGGTVLGPELIDPLVVE